MYATYLYLDDESVSFLLSKRAYMERVAPNRINVAIIVTTTNGIGGAYPLITPRSVHSHLHNLLNHVNNVVL